MTIDKNFPRELVLTITDIRDRTVPPGYYLHDALLEWMEVRNAENAIGIQSPRPSENYLASNGICICVTSSGFPEPQDPPPGTVFTETVTVQPEDLELLTDAEREAVFGDEA